MDKRGFLIDLLQKYKSYDSDEEESRVKMLKFVKENSECFENNFKPGHITGSSLVVDRNIEYTLLTHHSKLNKWFQFGGHSDGHYNPIEVAWREAEEESGLTSLAYLPNHEGIFDLDIHPIPEIDKMPLHFHYDVRILISADKTEPYVVSYESKDLKWVKISEVVKFNKQKAFLRLVDKAIKIGKKF